MCICAAIGSGAAHLPGFAKTICPAPKHCQFCKLVVFEVWAKMDDDQICSTNLSQLWGHIDFSFEDKIKSQTLKQFHVLWPSWHKQCLEA